MGLQFRAAFVTAARKASAYLTDGGAPTIGEAIMVNYATSLLISSALFCLSAAAQNPAAPGKVDFVKDLQPLLESNCVGCHSEAKTDGGPDGELDMTTREKIIEGGDHGEGMVPGDASKSRIYKDLIREENDKKLMPPKRTGGPMKKSEIEIIKAWIDQGADWPNGIILKQREKVEDKPPSPDNLELVKRIHAKIVATSKEAAEADMKAYTAAVPKIGKDFNLVVIKGGQFMMGSPDSEADRQPDEGPQVKVKVDPFWMGSHEVTWDLYMPFMVTPDARWKDGSKKVTTEKDTEVDAISSPTTPYTDMTFGMGQDGYPAVSMTEHAASKYCQWLSAQTGHFYRLPTEAEWEYAARAGTTTAYFFGDDSAGLDEYAWYQDNSDSEGTGQGKSQPVGQKKASPWGLYDIYGNVNEWVIDQYDPEWYKKLGSSGAEVLDPVNKPKALYPRVVRGGGFKSAAPNCRSAKRRFSVEAWKSQDPQLPKSIWYHTDAKFLGFRVVRPLKVPTVEEMFFYWNCGAEVKK